MEVQDEKSSSYFIHNTLGEYQSLSVSTIMLLYLLFVWCITTSSAWPWQLLVKARYTFVDNMWFNL